MSSNRSLGLWISSHQPPLTPKLDAPARAMSVWKAKGSSSGNNLVMAEASSNSNPAPVPVPVPVLVPVSNPSDNGPGQSFRNFELNRAPILKAIETAFT